VAGSEHFRNLETLRLVAAGSVIFSHAFLIVDGHERGEPLYALTGTILGGLGVAVFFVISGMLVAQSFERSRNVLEFAWKRFLRIYPGYIVSILIVGLTVAPFYWTSVPALAVQAKYLVNFGLLRTLEGTPEVAFYPGWVGAELNGSLWSIPVEVACYAIVGVLGVLSMLRFLPTILLFVAGTIFLFVTKDFRPETYLLDLAWGIPPFAAGVLMYLLHSRLEWRPGLGTIVTCLGALVAFGAAHVLSWAAAMPLAILILVLATSRRVTLGNAARFGDFSYGTYLYGWPIEQVVRATVGPVSPYLLTAISVPLAIAAGAISWHLIEARALRLKRPTPATAAS